eukprot:m.138122 g.138122  ORF g.138122 m.138122 type:complete len:59 (+) comp13260_c0_seq1:293-469(+)
MLLFRDISSESVSVVNHSTFTIKKSVLNFPTLMIYTRFTPLRAFIPRFSFLHHAIALC